jgi:hypothetical protein
MKKRSILEEEMEPEILERMPLWFRKLWEMYLKCRQKR